MTWFSNVWALLKMSNYDNFAYFYDELTKNIDYKKIAENYHFLTEKHGGKLGILLDLACGTGSLSEEFAKIGYDVIGVDSSTNMLNEALNKKYESGLPIQYLCQEMENLDMFGTIDVTVCTLDSLNHLKNAEALSKTIEKVSLFLDPNGLFLFDVNSKYKHEFVLENNCFVYDMDKVCCVWQNNFCPENFSTQIHLDFFEQCEDGRYERFEEDFSEIAFSTDEISRILDENGLEILEVLDYDSMKSTHEKSEKYLYVTRKRRK